MGGRNALRMGGGEEESRGRLVLGARLIEEEKNNLRRSEGRGRPISKGRNVNRCVNRVGSSEIRLSD